MLSDSIYIHNLQILRAIEHYTFPSLVNVNMITLDNVNAVK
jgi:hypothetical protein